MKPAIEIQNLSKVYRINHQRQASEYSTLRDALVDVVKKPIQFLTGDGLKKEEFWALRNINLEIQRGDVTGIIGRNGSGKSTLLKILSRIVEPTTGEVIMRGKVASLLEVGTGFHPELTGRENIYFNGAILGMRRKEIDHKFGAIVAFSEVEQFLDTPVKFYSSGMYVRLAFAVAAHLEPDILIVDEVLAVGDAAFQKKCLGKMRDVAGDGRTVILVSHSMETVMSICDNAVLMQNGRVSEIGPAYNVAQKYLNQVNKPESLTPLRERDRPTSAALSLEAKLIDVSVHGTNSDLPGLDASRPITIELLIDSVQDFKNKSSIHLVVSGSHGILLRAHTEFTDQDVALHKGLNKISCEIESTHLTGGNYQVDFSLSNAGGNKMGYIDYLEDTLRIAIAPPKTADSTKRLFEKDAALSPKIHWTTQKKG